MLSHPQKLRYNRAIILPEIGEGGQEKLLASKVLLVGVGGLGSPCLLYLASSGVGEIGIIDSDVVEISNLQRQVIYETSDAKSPKVDAAAQAIFDLNPEIKITKYNCKLDESNIDDILLKYDLVIDGSDNFSTRFLVNDKAIQYKKPLITAAILAFEGQISTFKGYEKNLPCYRCLYADIPPEGTMPNCSENGILAPVAGIMGTMQALEAIKELTGAGESLAGNLIVFDAKKSNFRKVKINKDKSCSCNRAKS
jgi:adenylyltransferase/sulfurtransferase